MWCSILLSLGSEEDHREPPGVQVAVAVYLGLFVALTQRAVLADVLKYTFLPALVFATWRVRHATATGEIVRWGCCAMTAGTMSLLAHNSSVAFLAAASLLMLGATPHRGRRFVAAALTLTAPLLFWWLVRHSLGQTGSHPLGWGLGRYGPGTYLAQILQGTGSLLVPSRLGAPLLALSSLALLIAMMIRRGVNRSALLFGLAFVGVSAAATYSLFNLTWVDDALAGRFLLFIPLILVPLTLAGAARWHRAAFLACAVLLLVPLTYRTARWSYKNSTRTLHQLGYPGGFVPLRATLSPEYWLLVRQQLDSRESP
jgi:hypothetical protein